MTSETPSSAELDDPPFDPARVGVLLVVRKTDTGQSERPGCGVGHEHVGPRADLVANGVLEQSMGDRDGRAEEVAPGSDHLAHRLTPMEHRLEVEVRDRRAGDADVVIRGDRARAAVDERLVHRRELLEDAVTVAIERRRRRGGEDGIAFELDQGEIGLDALDDGVEEVAEHAVGGGDARR